VYLRRQPRNRATAQRSDAELHTSEDIMMFPRESGHEDNPISGLWYDPILEGPDGQAKKVV